MGVPIRKSTRRLGKSTGASSSALKSKAPMSSTSQILADPAIGVPIVSVAEIDIVDSPHSPFFLHSADHPSLSLVADRLDETNYNHWCSAMKIALDAKNKLAFIDGSLPRPDEGNPIFRIWSRCNSMVKSWMLNAVSKQIYGSILNFDDATMVWKDLHNRFHMTNLPRTFYLIQQIQDLRQGSMDLSSYYTALKTLWDQLDGSEPTESCFCCRSFNCVSKRNYQEKVNRGRLIKFLAGLNESYSIIRGQIIMKKPLPDIAEVYNILDQDDRQRQFGVSVAPAAFQVGNVVPHPGVMNVIVAPTSAGSINQYRCYKLHGYPPGWKPRKQQFNASPPSQSFAPTPIVAAQVSASVDSNVKRSDGFESLIGNLSKDQLQNFIAYFSSHLTPQASSQTSQTLAPTTEASASGITFSNSTYCFIGVLTIAQYVTNRRSWIIDYGATHHVSHDRSMFNDLDIFVRQHVNLPNGSLVMDPTKGLTIGRGRRITNLYLLDVEEPADSRQLSSCSLNDEIDSAVWHKRLGHTSFSRIDMLSDVLGISKQRNKRVLHCDICQRAKQKKLPFSNRGNICFAPFDLLHIDVWGPFSEPTVEVFLINRTPSPLLENKTPYEKLTNKAPEYEDLRTFGCLCYASTSPKQRTKFEDRAKACVFLGYPAGYKGYKLMDIESNTDSKNQDGALEFFPHICTRVSNIGESSGFSDQGEPLASGRQGESIPEIVPYVFPPAVKVPKRVSRPPGYLQDYQCYSMQESTKHPISQVLSYSKLSDSFCAYVNALTKYPTPTSYSQASKIKEFCDAMDVEIVALKRAHTWDVCSLPPGKTVIGCKWVYIVKLNANGSLERYKARLVAKGYTQKEGLDYVETFSPVARMATVKFLLAFAAPRKWFLDQLDVSNAFLNGDLKEEIYMSLPPGYGPKEGESFPPNAVCKLRKSLYGLKQASRQWFLKLSESLVSLGFQGGTGDDTLFTRKTRDVHMAVLVYVDDIIIASSSSSATVSITMAMKETFKLRDLGPPKYFLGLEVARTSAGIYVCQRKYVLDLLDETGLLGCAPLPIPMDPSDVLNTETGTLLEDVEQYRRLVGKLLYLTFTRPDITFAVHKLCRFTSAPRQPHLNAVY
ncbi:PREDICTED: uncharacterized protein LOC104779049 [Camelina sativa]|uniref:Uncharacterized protein LOC104779049 n=1 Tax=Camelina sativa TaxID=90675 RepID=A0ABM0YJ50_CAMSA|nr:PREDICTED: uncharacterized protein LOC104779049 [Camelina sativa]